MSLIVFHSRSLSWAMSSMVSFPRNSSLYLRKLVSDRDNALKFRNALFSEPPNLCRYPDMPKCPVKISTILLIFVLFSCSNDLVFCPLWFLHRILDFLPTVVLFHWVFCAYWLYFPISYSQRAGSFISPHSAVIRHPYDAYCAILEVKVNWIYWTL